MLTSSNKLECYVLDNMEGAVDQAAVLASTESPVAIIGARGTGKMYVARILHAQAGGRADSLVAIDCREFRSRDDANRRIRQALLAGAGKTLVFKSPQLMSADAQLKLASVFAAYPIRVPPMRDRQCAILRWAQKILSQERASRNIAVQGFTPEAEQAMRQHPWHGNISEIRQRVVSALEQKPGAEWLTPVDLKLFLGGRATSGSLQSPLQGPAGCGSASGGYSPSARQERELALAEQGEPAVAGAGAAASGDLAGG